MCQCKETRDKENVPYRFVAPLNQSSQGLQSVSSLSDTHLFNFVTLHTAFMNILKFCIGQTERFCVSYDSIIKRLFSQTALIV